MGICASSTLTPAQQAQCDEDLRKERIIKAQMAEEKVSDQRTFKLLLLGAGESGKSTLFKQMLSIYGKGVSKEELAGLIGPIHSNLQFSMTALCNNVDKWAQVLVENEEACRYFQSQSSLLQDDVKLGPLQFMYMKSLWADPAIQTAWSHRSEYQIYDSTEYFMNKLDEISAGENYQPTEDDHLRIRVRTTGIVESAFEIENNNFKLFDVGGQRNERKKWIHCFENVTAVLFVAAISEYDQRLFEDETTNRLQEALKLFDDICNSLWFKRTALLLFLNKRDLFQEKIMRIPLAQFFPAYTGPAQDYQTAQQWILDQFLIKNRVPSKAIYPSVTTAIDTSNVRMVVNSVKDIIIRQALAQIGVG